MSSDLSRPGRRPYGETVAERATQRRISSMRRSRMTWQAIADVLNGSGVRQRNAKTWTAQRVAGVHARFVADADPQ